MAEIEPPHALTYRQEVVKPLFERLGAGDSCAVVGPASVGKTRLLEHILRREVQQNYLGALAEDTLVLRVDLNRLSQPAEWEFYELLLTTLIEGCDLHPKALQWKEEFNGLRKSVIREKEPLLAQRHLEEAVNALITHSGLKLDFLLDEFDEAYRILPVPALAKLRSLRDRYKYRLCYTLFLRHSPERLRNPDECESFYELFSRYIIGLGPYTRTDAEEVVTQIEFRRRQKLPLGDRTTLLYLSGGHPGLIHALFDIFIENPHWLQAQGGSARAAAHPNIAKECRKLWISLAEDEQRALLGIVQENDIPITIKESLVLKGILKDGKIFSELFANFVKDML